MTFVTRFLTDEGPRNTLILLISLAALVASAFDVTVLGQDVAWIAVVLCGGPIVWSALDGLARSRAITAGLLVTLALAACIYLDEIFAAGEVAFIMMLGELLEERTVARARAGIEKLVRLTPRTARRLHDGVEEVVVATQVRVGDVLRVLPGETVPVDGVVLDGRSAVDQSLINGEPLPADKEPGDELFGGTLNQLGALTYRATRESGDSAIGRMIALVRSADASKARIVRLMDRWARWIVYGAVLSAIGTWAVCFWLIGPEEALMRAASVLVVFCPCALVLATPTAIVAAIGNLTKYGILVRAGDALERLAGVRNIAFDKTGTLTWGRPEVVRVVPADPSLTEDRLLALAGAVEESSEHPLGKAVVRAARARQGHLDRASDFAMLPGMGVEGTVGGQSVLAGKAAFLESRSVSIPESVRHELETLAASGATPVHVAVDGRYAGLVALADTLRPEAPETVSRLKGLGMAPVLLTGDAPEAARTIARSAGIHTVRANCLPGDKLEAIDAMERRGEPLLMIGDGINDAPALKRARVGLAMGGVGSDIAVDAADVVLIRDDIRFVPHMVALSRRMMGTVRFNIAVSLGLNFLGIALAMAGLLNPFWAAIVHNAGSVIVVANSSLLLHWRRYPEKAPAKEIAAAVTAPLADGSLPKIEDEGHHHHACCSSCG
ncbi:cation-translocating P-type ATPase [Phaeovibrio sulfidiphilus]|uniref:P-type Zn(2+) transporter n=1 Tax=Phaeovibrio sulfidiphilus TaxID=1220600 RepID=A0A8J6YL40_9PROT|nr:cation-translocating P-type ATPase [Phaeovibrio sulfidiphilus]MBE1236508.1 cation-translocating P-type ATPase [Phaeovibrio sulfidiphilus]